MTSPRKGKENLQIRPVRPTDFSQIDQILTEGELDKGEAILKIWFDHTKTIWQVAVTEDGKIVASSILHQLPIPNELIVFRCFNNVIEEYQGLGLMGRFRQAYKNASTLGNATDEAISKMSSWFKKFGPKIVCYIGKPNFDHFEDIDQENLESFSIRPVTIEKDMTDLLKYDRLVFDLDRSKFMKEWCTQSEHGEKYARTLIARNKKSDQIMGFGTIRLFSKKFHIQPLYADNTEVAQAILDELIKLYISVSDTEDLAFNFFAKNRFMTDYAEKIGLKRSSCQTRAYTAGVDGQIRSAIVDEKLISFDRVYGVQYYWPV